MDIDETADLLAEVQLIDNRRVEEATLVAWHRLVDDLDYSEAVEAVRLHFRTSTAYLTPAHLRVAVDRIRLAGLGPREDEWGNEIEPDVPAVAAWERLHPTPKEITS